MKTVLVTGYSKAPQGTGMHEAYRTAGIILEIHKETHIVVDVDFTFVTGLAKDYVRRLIIGIDVSKGLDELIQHIKEHYYAPSQQALIVALKVAIQRYWDNVKETTDEPRA